MQACTCIYIFVLSILYYLIVFIIGFNNDLTMYMPMQLNSVKCLLYLNTVLSYNSFPFDFTVINYTLFGQVYTVLHFVYQFPVCKMNYFLITCMHFE